MRGKGKEERKKGKKEEEKNIRTKNIGRMGKKDDFAVTILGNFFQIGQGKAFIIDGTIYTPA